MPPDHPTTPRQGILSLNIKSKNNLYAAYMPYLKNGGLFIPTTKSYSLGDDIFMVLTFMVSRKSCPVAGRVVWVTPPGPRGTVCPGRSPV